MNASTPRTPFGTGNFLTSFIVMPWAASIALAKRPAIFCLVYLEGTRLPRMSANVLMGESFGTYQPNISGKSDATMRTLDCFLPLNIFAPVLAKAVTTLTEMVKSSLPLFSSGSVTTGPPWGTTRIFTPAFSIATLATPAPVAYAKEPWGLVPILIVWAWAFAAASPVSAAAVMNILKFISILRISVI